MTWNGNEPLTGLRLRENPQGERFLVVRRSPKPGPGHQLLWACVSMGLVEVWVSVGNILGEAGESLEGRTFCYSRVFSETVSVPWEGETKIHFLPRACGTNVTLS